ncbi:MAG: hypothetical protein ACU0CO_03100 [Shimia sp.]
MLLRAILILGFLGAAAVAASVLFGAEVVFALGLIWVQAKVLFGKIGSLTWPTVAKWLKLHGLTFVRRDVWMRWMTSTALPMVVGNAVLRRFAGALARLRADVGLRYAAIRGWYRALPPIPRFAATLVLLGAAIGAGLASVGIWVILFSVQLPIWMVALAATLARTVLRTVEKTVFKTLAFLQLGWLWTALRRVLPARWLIAMRRWNRRVAREVIGRRRRTTRRVAERMGRRRS